MGEGRRDKMAGAIVESTQQKGILCPGPKIVEADDFVILFERHDKMHGLRMVHGETIQNRFGLFHHTDVIGQPFGSRVFSRSPGANGSGFMWILPPTPELWTIALPHRTQILYTADISLVVTHLELTPGKIVVESGTGSGSLSASLARSVAPSGKVFTFEFNAMRCEKAGEDFIMNGADSIVTIAERDVLQDGFELPPDTLADAVFLDLPAPWTVVKSARAVMKPGGRICNFSPCIEQVQQVAAALEAENFHDIRTYEILVRSFEVQKQLSKEVGKSKKRKRQEVQKQRAELRGGQSGEGKLVTKPYMEMKGHTGFLTFAILLHDQIN